MSATLDRGILRKAYAEGQECGLNADRSHIGRRSTEILNGLRPLTRDPKRSTTASGVDQDLWNTWSWEPYSYASEFTDVTRASASATSTKQISLLPSLDRIRTMAELPENWDGEDAERPSASAVAAACYLIVAVAEFQERNTDRCRKPWTSAPLPDGGLQVEWLGPASRIDVEIADDGSFGYMLKMGSGGNAEYKEEDNVEFGALLDLIARVLASKSAD